MKQKEAANASAKQVETMEEAINVIRGSFEAIQTHVMLKRSKDCSEIVRKSVFEFILQMEASEL